MRRFPILVQKSLHILYAQRPVIVHQRTAEEKRKLRSIRLSKIPFLEDYFISRAAAHIAVNLFWEEEVPFCLFLRSYKLGHQVIPSIEETGNGGINDIDFL